MHEDVAQFLQVLVAADAVSFLRSGRRAKGEDCIVQTAYPAWVGRLSRAPFTELAAEIRSHKLP
jgi:hypothetical protein